MNVTIQTHSEILEGRISERKRDSWELCFEELLGIC